MMDLHTQIVTLLFSLGYGILFASILDIIHKPLFKMKLFLQILISFLFVIGSALLYFLILLNLNKAILHPYFILLFLLGFVIENIIKKIGKRFFQKFSKAETQS